MLDISIPELVKTDPVACEVWQSLARSYKAKSDPKSVVLDAMVRYCHYSSVYRKAQDDVQTNGPTLVAVNGIRYANPALKVMHQSQNQLDKLAKSFEYMLG